MIHKMIHKNDSQKHKQHEIDTLGNKVRPTKENHKREAHKNGSKKVSTEISVQRNFERLRLTKMNKKLFTKIIHKIRLIKVSQK